MRIIVENTIGALKMRFPILKNTMRIRRRKFSTLLLGCVILHNTMNGMGIPMPPDTILDDMGDLDENVQVPPDRWNGEQENKTTRDIILDLV